MPDNKIVIIHVKTTALVTNTVLQLVCNANRVAVRGSPNVCSGEQTSGSVGDGAPASLPVMRLKRPSSLRAGMTTLSKPPRLLQSIKQADYCPQLIWGGGVLQSYIALLKMRIG